MTEPADIAITLELEGSDILEQALHDLKEMRESAEEYAAMAKSYMQETVRLQNELNALRLKYELPGDVDGN